MFNIEPIKELLAAVLVGLIGAVLLRGVYAILNFRRSSLEMPSTDIRNDLPLNYISITELLAQRDRKWVQ